MKYLMRKCSQITIDIAASESSKTYSIDYQ